MTAETLNELRDELEQLRRQTRAEIAQRLREARAYGDGSNNDEHHAVVEEQMVLEARRGNRPRKRFARRRSQPAPRWVRR